MLDSGFTTEAAVRPGEKLRDLRDRLGITTREVALQSHLIAQIQGNPEFCISNAWLTQLENTDSIPSLHKLASLSSIYRVTFPALASLFGVDLDSIGKYHTQNATDETRPINLDNADTAKTMVFPSHLVEGYSLDGTNLLSRLVDQWGEIPIAVLQHLDLRSQQYGFIGLQDFTLFPMLKPGSLVQIDPQVRKVKASLCHTEFDRSIYFLEVRGGYACGWCEQAGNTLSLLSHPLSPCPVRSFHYPDDVEVVGQVVGVAMRLVASLSRTMVAAATETAGVGVSKL
jgi:transcriptional regulator with XRE-family HTH domain